MNTKDRERITRLYSAITRAPRIPFVMDTVKLGKQVRFEDDFCRQLASAILSIRDSDDEEAGADPEGDIDELEQIVNDERERRGVA